MLKYALLFAVAAVVATGVTPLVRRLGFALGAVDMPGGRRIHRAPTPRLGGLPIYLAIVLGLGLVAPFDHFVLSAITRHGWRTLALLGGGTVVLVLGMLDDCFSVTPLVKLAVEIAVGGVAVAGGFRINTAFGLSLGWLGVPLTILWVVAITNGVNLVDGLDGLAAGVGLMVSAVLFSISLALGNIEPAVILVVIAGALLGFLRWNFHPARIFMGDSGALLVGFLLSVVSIEASAKSAAVAALAVPMLALGLPLAEVGLTTMRRALSAIKVVRLDERRERYEFSLLGRATVFTADRGHIHHRLLDLGINQRTAVLVLYLTTLLLGGLAFLMVSRRGANEALMLGAFAVAIVAGIRWLGYEELRPLRSGLLLPLFELPATARNLIYVLADLSFIVLSYLGALLISHGAGLTPAMRATFVGTLPLLAFVQVGCLSAAGLYRRSYRYAGMNDYIALVKILCLTAAVTWLAMVVTGRWAYPSLNLLVLDAYLLATMLIGSRGAFRVLDHMFKDRREAARRVLIYGAGNGGAMALHEISGNPALKMRVVGFLDDDPAKAAHRVQGFPVYKAEALAGLIAGHEFDEMILSSSKIAGERLDAAARRCALAGLPMRRFSIEWEDALPGAGGALEKAG